VRKAHERSHHRSAAIIRHSLRDGFTVSFVLAPETGFVVSVAGAMRRHCHQLDISVGISGPHDFAVRIGASRQHAPIRPSHSTPNVRDDREAPLLFGRGTGRGRKGDLPVGARGILHGAKNSLLTVGNNFSGGSLARLITEEFESGLINALLGDPSLGNAKDGLARTRAVLHLKTRSRREPSESSLPNKGGSTPVGHFVQRAAVTVKKDL
jgi:hypothetical protein